MISSVGTSSSGGVAALSSDSYRLCRGSWLCHTQYQHNFTAVYILYVSCGVCVTTLCLPTTYTHVWYIDPSIPHTVPGSVLLFCDCVHVSYVEKVYLKTSWAFQSIPSHSSALMAAILAAQ